MRKRLMLSLLGIGAVLVMGVSCGKLAECSASTCEGDQMRMCVDGVYSAPEDCSTGQKCMTMADSASMCMDASCTGTEARCDGTTDIRTCEGGTLGDKVACPAGEMCMTMGSMDVCMT